MPAERRVALQGFSAFERDALKSFFRLATGRTPAYALADSLDTAAFIVADTEHAAGIAAVHAAGRSADTVFVGAHPPDDAMARLPRPVDPLLILRELDALSGQQVELPAPAAQRPAVRPVDLTVPVAVEPLDVLVVDDSDVAQRFLAHLVQRLGLRPTQAGSSGRALELLAERRYAFVLLDVMLGDDSELDGLALCQHIKHQRPGRSGEAPHVVLVSAHAQAADRVRGSLAGCDGYLTKPLDEALLARTLADLAPAAFGTSTRRRPGKHRPPRDQ